MLELPSVTLVCADCVYVPNAIASLERCKALCNFGAVKLLTSVKTDYSHRVEIGHLGSVNAYSVFMVKKLHEYIDTPHMLVVQHDAWVLHPESWDSRWLDYDYTAPLFNQYNIIGSGGFSLRSKALMAEVSRRYPAWDGTQENAEVLQAGFGAYEDGVTSGACHGQFRLAPLEEGARFGACGNTDPRYYVKRPFGFHRFSNSIEDDLLNLQERVKT